MPAHSAPPPARADLLLSPLLLGSLALLLLNDHVLKAAYGNWLTGKLSDFAGLLAFALFWRAMLPRRRMPACAAAGLAFAYWKSPAAQPLIDALNAAGAGVGRVVDWTDLAALAVLPLACAYAPRPRGSAPARRALSSAVAAACVAAFAATSPIRVPPLALDAEYAFPEPPDTLLARMYELRVDHRARGVPAVLPDSGDSVLIFLKTPPGTPAELMTVAVAFGEREGGGTSLRPLAVEMTYGSRGVTPGAARRAFEAQVVEPLRRNTPGEPAPLAHTGGPQAAFYRPVLLGPYALYESRAEVHISLEKPAYVAVVDITPDDVWQVIYPVEARAEVKLAAGEHTLRTVCAAEPSARAAEPAEPVGRCGVARRVTPADVRRFDAPADHRCGGWARTRRIAAGRLVVIAASDPLRREELQAAAATLCRASAAQPYQTGELNRVLRALGVRAWAAAEAVLRR